MAELISTGVCGKCKQQLVQEGDILRCPGCGEKLSLALLHAAVRLRVPFPGSFPSATGRDLKADKDRLRFAELWRQLGRKP